MSLQQQRLANLRADIERADTDLLQSLRNGFARFNTPQCNATVEMIDAELEHRRNASCADWFAQLQHVETALESLS